MTNLDKLNAILAEQEERSCQIFGDNNIFRALNDAKKKTAGTCKRDCTCKLCSAKGNKECRSDQCSGIEQKPDQK